MTQTLTKKEKDALAAIVRERMCRGVSDTAHALGITESEAGKTLDRALSAIRKLYATTERVQ